MAEANSTQRTHADIEVGRRDIELGLTTLSTLIGFIDGIHPDEYDPRMQAVLALAQKAGALLERGVGRAVGECGIIGAEGVWITDPGERRARANLQGGYHA